MPRDRRTAPLPPTIRAPRFERRRLVSLAIVLFASGTIVCERSRHARPQGDDHARYHDRTFRVARVIDGDTLDIDIADGDKYVTRIRLLGVDAPETGHGRDGEMYFGTRASEFAEERLRGRTVHVVLPRERTRGKFGRLLAYVHLERGGPMFNETLIEEGLAYADLRFQHHYYRQFKAIETRARREGRGLWADVTIEKMPAWRRRFEKRTTATSE